MLRSAGGGLFVLGTDLTTCGRAFVDGQCTDPGAALVNPIPVAKFLRYSQRAETVRLTRDGDHVVLTESSGRVLRVRATDSSSFPVIPDPPNDGWTAAPERFIDGVRRLASVVNERHEPKAGSLLVRSDGRLCTLVATDWHRMSIFETRWSAPSFEALICKRGASLIGKAFAGRQPPQIAVSQELFTVACDGAIVQTKLAKGPFVPYETAIPVDEDRIFAHAERSRLERAVEAIASFAKPQRFPSVKVDAVPGQIAFTWTGNGTTVCEEVQAETFGPSRSTEVSAVYLFDAVRSMDTESVCLSLGRSAAPVAVSSDTGRKRCIIAPYNHA